MTANLQITVKEAARIMNVSERSVYMMRKIMRLRPDLIPDIEAGTLTINAAMDKINKKPPQTSWERLVKAWNAATEEDRIRLISEATKGWSKA